MRHVPLSALEDAIIKPGFEKQLVPLLHFKGHADLGRIHRLWNLVVSMHEHECETIGEGVHHLMLNPERSQLCLPPRRPQMLYGFLSRLQLKPHVTNERPGLLDYVRSLMPWPYQLAPVSEIAHRQRHAWWRHFEPRRNPREPRKFVLKEKPQELVYPFVIHDGGRPEHELVRLVNNIIPKGLSPDFRADVCQDLIVGILTGDFDKNDLYLPSKEMMKRMRRMFPDKYGPISLDAMISGTDGLRLIDTI